MNSRQIVRLLPAAACAALLMTACANEPTGPSAVSQAFSPPPPADRGGPNGIYVVTLTASPSCDAVLNSVTGRTAAFPEAARVRQYEGEFAGGKGRLTAVHDPGNKVVIEDMFMTGTGLTIIVWPAVPLTTATSCAGGDYWWEVLEEHPAGGLSAFELCGTWRGSTVDPARIEGTIDGAFVFYEGYASTPRVNQFCRASDHRFTMVRK